MSDYPHPELLPLLKLTASVKEQHKTRELPERWISLIYDLKRSPGETKVRNEKYLAIRPDYIFARCPFCNMSVREGIDHYTLYRLNRWRLVDNDLSTAIIGSASIFPRQPSCPHYWGCQSFLNLHHAMPPVDVDCASGMVPYLSNTLFGCEEIQTRAVLHALPICTPQVDYFEPQYTLYVLTYFMDKPQSYFDYHVAHQQHDYENLIEEGYEDEDIYDFVKSLIDHPKFGNYDLEKACAEGKLGWLDFTQPDELPLRIGEGLELPLIYQNIKGIRGEYKWSGVRQRYSIGSSYTYSNVTLDEYFQYQAESGNFF